MLIEDRLVQFCCKIPHIPTVRDRLILGYSEPELVNLINWEGSNLAVFRELITYLASKGSSNLISFLQRLEGTEMLGLEDKIFLREIIANVKSLPKKHWNREFPNASASTASSLLTRREILSSLLVGLGIGAMEQVFSLFSPSKRENFLLRWNQFIDPEPAEYFNADNLMLLFGSEPSKCGIIPGIVISI
ncbi:MAG: hypothetical protein HC862_10590 [Scytonema sp. RU_4_4]|nr:hypothetical protein [Scytonema sp. RU_4_4]